MRPSRKTLFAIAAVITVALIVPICLGIGFSSCAQTLDFSQSFYYVCYDSPTGESSASSISSVVNSYGGAGYVIRKGNDYFVTLSCYYSQRDADAVCSALRGRGLNCNTVCVECGNYVLRGRERGNANLFTGNLNTLTQLSVVLYELANSLDNYSFGQREARAVLSHFNDGLSTLIKENRSNCFTKELNRLKAEYDDVSADYILSREVRRLQVAVTDAVANVNIN